MPIPKGASLCAVSSLVFPYHHIQTHTRKRFVLQPLRSLLWLNYKADCIFFNVSLLTPFHFPLWHVHTCVCLYVYVVCVWRGYGVFVNVYACEYVCVCLCATVSVGWLVFDQCIHTFTYVTLKIFSTH